MYFNIKIFFTGFLIFIFLFVGINVYLRSDSKSMISPISQLTNISFADNVWYPKKNNFSVLGAESTSEITAQAYLFVDMQKGQILYEKNSYQKLPIASLVKIMTVIIALESRNLDDVLSVSERAANMESDKMFLLGGEKLTVKELLQGIFLVSANDAAEVLAENSTGRREEFINLMNSKAKMLGMNDTNFINPTGLEEENKKQLSTAYDVALMARFAIHKWPELLTISSKPHIYIERNGNHQDYDLYSGINLLTTYPGVMGFKTGYTPESGLTLVTFAKKEDKKVLGVLLNSTSRRDDAKILLDYSFNKLGIE